MASKHAGREGMLDQSSGHHVCPEAKKRKHRKSPGQDIAPRYAPSDLRHLPFRRFPNLPPYNNAVII